MKRKNTVHILMWIIIVCFLFTYTPCEAVKTNVLFELGLEEDSEGLAVQIRISENSDICALEFDLWYNTNKLEYITHTISPILESGIYQINDKNNGEFLGAFISTVPLVDGGELVTLYFSTQSEYVQKEDVVLTIREAANEKGKALDFEIQQNGFQQETIKEPADIKDDKEELQTNEKPLKTTTPPESIPQETRDSEHTVLNETKTKDILENEKITEESTLYQTTPTEQHESTGNQHIEDTNENGEKKSPTIGVTITVVVASITLLLIIGVISFIYKRKKGKS